MRTKVEKRRVRHEHAGNLPSAAAASFPASSVPVLSLQGDASKSFPVVSSVTADKHCLSWDVSDRRPVSLSEAERLAAANHVVVALGPPVICPSRVVVDIKGDGVIGVAGSCSGGNSGGDTTVEKGTADVHRHLEHALAEDKKSGSVPIKKPPKKRRNSERKVELVVDHVSSPSLYTPGSFPLVTSKPHMSEASGHSSMFSSEPQQQQQQQQPLVAATGSLPPLQPQQHSFAPTPPTPSPPHQPLALLHKIPHSQNFSSSPQQVLSSQLSMTDADLPADGNANVSDPHSFISQKVPTIFHSVNLEPGHTTADEEVMPSRNLQSRTPSSHIEPISNSSGCVDEDGGESSVSTSLLQPPTWLLTPQENTPPVETSYGLEQPLTYDLASSETANPLPSVAHDGLVTSPSSSAASTKENVETGDKVSSSKISSKAKSSNTEGTEKKKKSMKKKKNIAGDKSNGAETSQCLQPVDSQKDDATKIIACEAENTLDSAKPTLKPKKTSRRSLPSQDNESKAQRLAEIEETINFVIANFVYSCEDLSTVDRLTGGAKDEGQVASAVDSAKTNSAEDVQTTAVDTTMSSLSKASIRNKSVKKSKKKEESSEKVDTQEFTQETNDPDTVEITKPPKKVSKKKKISGDSLSGEKSKVDKKLSDKELEMAGSEQMKNDEDTAKPPPNKKKKKSPKKKEESSSQGTEPMPPSKVIPNGHIDPMTTEETRKTPKKKKSKPKAKKDTSTASGNETASSLSPEGVGTGCRVIHVTESCQTEIEGNPIINAASTKTAPKKSKKRKADAAQENSEVDKRPGVVSEKIAGGEQVSMPSPKKKKKKEKDESNNNAPEATKKKKSPSKSKKIKHLQGQEGEGDVKENGFSNSHDENRNSATSDSKSSGSGEENTEARVELDNSSSTQNGGTPISSGSGSRSGGSRKYKKQLDIVVCPGCGHKTRGQAALSRHMKKMHEKSVVLPYPCPQETCEYSASKVSLLARHMLTHSVYMCSRCQFMVDTKDKYEEHLQAAHNVKLDCKLCKKCNRYVKCDSVPMEQHLETCQGPVPFTCDVCNKQFKYESSLKVHHQTHFPDLPKLFHCQQCNYQSNYRANLHKHVQNMHIQRPKDIQCLKCDKMFSTEDNMKRHMKVHSQIRPYKCDKCDKAFKSSCALRGHIVSHELVRPYRCNIENCNREFRTPKFLKSHQEEFHRLIPKRYHCTVEGCKFSFFKLSHLKRHEISHTGERNFHCEWPGCGKSFRHSDNLKVHLRQHTDERPVSCSKCAFTCRQKSSLQWHMKKIHGITSVPVSNSENSSMDAASSTSLTPLGELDIATVPVGAEEMVVDVEVVNVIIPAGESGELPVTITELRPVDLYEFHSDNDSSDEAKPGVFKRNKSKMAATAPLPPPPKELLLKNSVLDVLDEANNRVDTTDSKPKAKKKKSVRKSSKTGSQIPTSAQEENEDREDKEAVPDENKNAEIKPAPKTASKSKKPSASKQKKKKSVAKDAAEVSKKSVEQSNTKEDIKVVEKKDTEPSVKLPSKSKKSPVKKKAPAKKLSKEVSVVKKTPPKPSALAKGKKSPKTRSSPKKPSSPKGKPAAQATRKTPPRKAANKKEKSVKSPPKKSPPKKVVAKKKTAKKKASLKKKAATKKSKKKLEKVDEPQKNDQDVTTPQESEINPRELSRSPRRSQVLSAKEQSNRLDEEPSPIRPDSAMESEEENMPQGKGSPYRDFDSQEMEESSPEPQESPSPPASPLPGDLLHQSPKSENEEADQQEGDELIPLPAELQAEMMDQREEDDSFDEEVINDIPLTPPRAPAPPPPETSDEEEMVPSPPPPTQMPMSTDASNPTPSSVLTDIQQPGSQATEFQQPLSREDFQQSHSREDFQQPHSREEFQQPLSQSREEYQQQHSREEVLQPHSREEYPQQHSREDMHQMHREEIHQQHSMEELQSQGSVPESMSEPVPSVHSDGMRDDVSLPHSVVQYNPTSATPVSEAESTYQYFQGLAQQPDDSLSEPLAGEPSRLQQLEALAEKPHDDRRSTGEIGVKSPTGAPTSVITSLSPTATSSMNLVTDLSSHRRMEILANDRPMDAHLVRDTPSALPRLPEPPFDAYSALNPLASGAARDNSNLFPAPPSTPSFMRLTESEAMLQRQRMTTPFLPTPQPPERSLSRLPESSLRPPNPSALLRRPATMAGADMFAGTPGVPQAMPRHPFTNSWPGQDARPSHWGQAPTYLQRSANAPTTPFPFPTKDNYLAGREFMFDPSVRTSVTDRNMFASLSSSQTQRDLTSEPSPFQLDRFDLSTYFGSHPYTGTSGLDYSRTACGTTPKTFDERYRQTAASMSEFRPLPPTTSADMFSGIGVGVNSLNSASFNLDKYAVYGRDPMYHAAQQLSDNTNSAFLTHTTPAQHSVFDRDYTHRSLYPHQNPAYPFIDERQYPAAAKLTGNPATMAQERDFMARPSPGENQMQDPYRCGMLYNVMNRYTFE